MEDISDLETLSSVISRVPEECYHDATLLVEGEEIPVYKGILASWGTYFEVLFQVEADQSSSDSFMLVDVNSQYTVETEEAEVRNNDAYELSNVKAEVFKGVLHYMYSGTYTFQGKVENHWHALELAHLYNLESLETKLVYHLVKSINVENFVDLFNVQTQIQNDELGISCLDFLKKNADEIAKSDNFPRLTLDSLLLLLDEDSFATAEFNIFRAAEKWAYVNKPNKETINAIVKKIRLATISQKDLFLVVAASKDLPSIDIFEAVKSIAMKDAASTNFRQSPSEVFPVDKNVALSSLGAKLLTGTFKKSNLISGSDGWTTHRVGGQPDCITVQLDKPYKINHLKFNFNDGRTYKYYIEVSVDGMEWFKIIDRSNIPLRAPQQSLNFNPIEVRYIKLTGVNCTEFTISSLEALYSTSKCEMIEGVPVATTNLTLASKGARTNHDFFLFQCIDGKETTASVLKGNETLYITLPQPHWISSLRMLLDAHGNNYTIESSPDGVSWQPVCNEVLGDDKQVWREFEFTRRVVAQFRIRMKQINRYNWPLYLFCFESPSNLRTRVKLQSVC